MKYFVASGESALRGLPVSQVKSAKANGSAGALNHFTSVCGIQADKSFPRSRNAGDKTDDALARFSRCLDRFPQTRKRHVGIVGVGVADFANVVTLEKSASAIHHRGRRS